MLQLPKKIIRKLANLYGYDITKKDFIMDKDARFQSIYQKSKNYTMTSKERMYGLYKSVEYIVNAKIPGDIVECGVWKGGSAMIIAYTLLAMGETGRKIYCYDTFEGTARPTETDYALLNESRRALNIWEKNQRDKINTWCFSPLPEAKANILSTKYPEENIIFVVGKVEDTIPQTMPVEIALLRLDTDWHESTKHNLIHLFPLVTKGGVLIINAYGCWSGTKKAVDEYFLDKPILLNRIDNEGEARLGVKIE